MTRGRRVLNAQQQAALDAVDRADDEFRSVKKHALDEAMRKAEQEIALVGLARDRAVYAAVKLGVPKTQIGVAIGTKNPYAVIEAHDRAARIVEATGMEPVEAEVPLPRFKWGDVLAVDHKFVYGWVIDRDDELVETTSPVDPTKKPRRGFWVVVDRRSGTSSLHRGSDFYAPSDSGYDELREWAVAHAGEAVVT